MKKYYKLVSKYEVRFHELTHHASMILPVEEENVRYFVRGLRFQFRIETKSMISANHLFFNIIDLARTLEQLCYEVQGAKIRGLDMRVAIMDFDPSLGTFIDSNNSSNKAISVGLFESLYSLRMITIIRMFQDVTAIYLLQAIV